MFSGHLVGNFNEYQYYLYLTKRSYKFKVTYIYIHTFHFKRRIKTPKIVLNSSQIQKKNIYDLLKKSFYDS